MFKKAMLAVVVTLLVMPVLYAGETGSAEATAKTSDTAVAGTIVQIDLQAKTITLKVEGKGKSESATSVFSYNDKTSFQKHSESTQPETMKPEDLKVGDSVRIEADSNNLATAVHLQPGASATGAQEPSKEK